MVSSETCLDTINVDDTASRQKNFAHTPQL